MKETHYLRYFFVGFLLISIGVILNIYLFRNPEYYFYFQLAVFVLYFSGLFEIVSGIYVLLSKKAPLDTLIELLGKLRTKLFKSSVIKSALIPMIIGLLIAIFVIPEVYKKFYTSKMTSAAYKKLISSLRHDEDVSVKRAAAISLGNIGDEQSLALLASEAIEKPYLSDISKKFISESDEKEKIDIKDEDQEKLLLELEKTINNRELHESDYQQRINAAIDIGIHNIRKLKKWLSREELTASEKVIVEQLKLINDLDKAIDNLKTIGDSYNDNDNVFDYDFFAIINSVKKEIDSFNKNSTRLKKDKDIAMESIITINKFNKTISVYKNQLTNENDNKTESQIDKYCKIIDTMVQSGVKQTKHVFTKVACEKTVAYSIRCEAIESLGIIGDVKDLENILRTMEESDPGIRKAGAIAIGMILSGKKNRNLHCCPGKLFCK